MTRSRGARERWRRRGLWRFIAACGAAGLLVLAMAGTASAAASKYVITQGPPGFDPAPGAEGDMAFDPDTLVDLGGPASSILAGPLKEVLVEGHMRTWVEPSAQHALVAMALVVSESGHASEIMGGFSAALPPGARELATGDIPNGRGGIATVEGVNLGMVGMARGDVVSIVILAGAGGAIDEAALLEAAGRQGELLPPEPAGLLRTIVIGAIGGAGLGAVIAAARALMKPKASPLDLSALPAMAGEAALGDRPRLLAALGPDGSGAVPGATLTAAPAAAPPAQRPAVPADWHPDPTGRHAHRYWDGEVWTAHVADDGVRGHDPI